MDVRQQEQLIRANDAGQPEEVQVTFTVTVAMTAQQRDAYEADHGVGFVSAEVEGRFAQEAPEALRSIPWVGKYARVRVGGSKIEKG